MAFRERLKPRRKMLSETHVLARFQDPRDTSQLFMQYAVIQALLAAEAMEDHLLVEAGAPSHHARTRPGQTLCCKLLCCPRQNPVAASATIQLPPHLRVYSA